MCLITEQFTRGNGKEIVDMALAYRYGLMGQSMKVNGRITRLMEGESFIMLREMYMMAIGRMIKLMGLELMCMLMELRMRENGKMIYRMERG